MAGRVPGFAPAAFGPPRERSRRQRCASAGRRHAPSRTAAPATAAACRLACAARVEGGGARRFKEGHGKEGVIASRHVASLHTQVSSVVEAGALQ
eukprot:354900-Chlamydomonas_euryale.AAC.7